MMRNAEVKFQNTCKHIHAQPLCAPNTFPRPSLGTLQPPLPFSTLKINCKDITGMTPLMLACKLGNEPMVEKLIEMGAGCEKRDKAGWTPLHYASYSGDIDTIDTLLDQGVPHRKKDKFGLCPVDWAHYMGHGEAEAFLEDYRPTMDLDRYQHW